MADKKDQVADKSTDTKAQKKPTTTKTTDSTKTNVDSATKKDN